jgi:hypothetical protein
MEGFVSTIHADGSQPMHVCVRNDCCGETAGALALASAAQHSAVMKQIAFRLSDFIHFSSVMCNDKRAYPDAASFGLFGWHDGCTGYRTLKGNDDLVRQQAHYAVIEGWKAFYSNARMMLGAMTAAAALKTDRWNRPLLRGLLANLRTTGQLGFRHNRIEQEVLEDKGWRFFFEDQSTIYAPHFQAYLWADFLWAYRQTGLDLFFQRTQNAIRMTMDAYPDKWQWMNGLQQERARMLLPLAWLVQVDDTRLHRKWLRRIAEDMLALQDSCGAIREEIGASGMGTFGPPVSNEAYGTNEAPLIQANGDPLTDLLYTANYAFLGLHEAAAATGDKFYCHASDKLTEFFCRIQIRSDSHPELDGAWFRAFDFKRWDYWASNADPDWGAWSIESGWTQSWIVAVLALRKLRVSLWDFTAKSNIRQHLPELLPLMLPKESRACQIINKK